MKKRMVARFVYVVAMCVVATGVMAHDVPSAESYVVNFDRSTKRTRADRVLSVLTLDDATLVVAQPGMMYNDMTHKCA